MDRETCSRIIGCQSQMSQFRFFFGLNLAHTVYSLTDNLSKTLQKEQLFPSEGKSVATKTVETFQNMRSESSADLFFEVVSRKASSFNFIADPELPRKRKNPNYKTLNVFFTVNDPQSQSSEPYHPKTVKEHYRTTGMSKVRPADQIRPSVKCYPARSLVMKYITLVYCYLARSINILHLPTKGQQQVTQHNSQPA